MLKQLVTSTSWQDLLGQRPTTNLVVHFDRGKQYCPTPVMPRSIGYLFCVSSTPHSQHTGHKY